MVFYFSVTILILALGAQLTLRSFGKRDAARDVVPSPSRVILNEMKNLFRLAQDKLREGSQDFSPASWRTQNDRWEKIFQWVFYVSVILIFTNSFYLSYSQYKIWKFGPFLEFTKFFLPPHQNINYFIGYALFYFFATYLVSLVFAILFLKAAKYYNKKYEEKFFYQEEYYLGALAIFLSGFPGVFLYIISLFIASVLGSLILNRFFTLKGERMSFYYLWIPVAIFVIIISKYLQQLPIWQLFKL